MSDGTSRAVDAAGYMEVPLRIRLWASLPQTEKVTAALVHARFPALAYGAPPTPGRYAAFVAERLVNRIERAARGEGCAAAVRALNFGKNMWLPCAGETYGEGLCKRHGGKGRPARESNPQRRPRWISALVEENQLLRQQVAQLEAERANFEAAIDALGSVGNTQGKTDRGPALTGTEADTNKETTR